MAHFFFHIYAASVNPFHSSQFSLLPLSSVHPKPSTAAWTPRSPCSLLSNLQCCVWWMSPGFDAGLWLGDYLKILKHNFAFICSQEKMKINTHNLEHWMSPNWGVSRAASPFIASYSSYSHQMLQVRVPWAKLLKFGGRVFSMEGCRLWNSYPQEMRLLLLGVSIRTYSLCRPSPDNVG